MEELQKTSSSYNLDANRKEQKKKFNLNVIELKWYWNIVALVLLAGFITMTTFYIQPGSFKEVLGMIKDQPLILILNYLPPLLVLIGVYFAINNVFYAAAITSGVFNLLSMINRVKIELRDEPLVPRDVQLLQEAGNSLANFEIDLNYMLIALMIGAIVLLIIGGQFLKSKKMPVPLRVGGVILAITLAFLGNKYIYSSKVVYFHKLKTSNRSYVTRVYTELGFTYCFLYNLNTYPVEKPENFSKEEVEGWIKEYGETSEVKEPTVKPHVFMIMNEAFSDITKDERFTYTQDNDPLKYYKALEASGNSISGHIVTPGFGGGTANTEFDVLTGMQTNVLNSVATSAFRVVGKNTQTIPRLLQEHDYEAFYLHPGDSWFYNRMSVYKYFGIDDQIFNEAFTKEDKKGNMISDESVTRELIKQFEERTANSNSPIFNYTTTIQNHMAYTVNKYGTLEIEEVPLSVEVSQEAKDFLSVYLQGVKDADQMLKDLTDYFNAQEEPVVLVFFGDHLPNLGDNYFSYKEVGLDVGNESNAEEVINTYTTPFMIWANDTAIEGLNWEEATKALDLPEDHRINANYLGAMLMELLGYEGQDEFIDFVNGLRREIPVFWKKNYQSREQGYTTGLSDEEQELLNKFHRWEYYKMKVERLNK